jgi:5'-AMP-activated protein kinase beta subunit, interaction domain
MIDVWIRYLSAIRIRTPHFITSCFKSTDTFIEFCLLFRPIIQMLRIQSINSKHPYYFSSLPPFHLSSFTSLPPFFSPLSLTQPTPTTDPMALPVPQHVSLNHLYCTAIKDGMMVLGATQRYKEKFFTVVFYSVMPGSGGSH